MSIKVWLVAMMLAGSVAVADDGLKVVVRTYSGEGAKELFTLIDEKKAEVEQLLRSVAGLVSYTAAHTADGGYTITVCKDQAGIDESVRVAREWVAKNGGHLNAKPPQITEGSVILHQCCPVQIPCKIN